MEDMKRITLLLGLSTFLFSGCVLDTLVDCRNLCERYADCTGNRGFDIDGCTTRCESRVEAGEEDQADKCDACLDNQTTCLGAGLACSPDCAPPLAP